jgi:hypothetical protein
LLKKMIEHLLKAARFQILTGEVDPVRWTADRVN